ncbi:MAG: superoxide dismutase [Anaerotruncus massiliensis (ex Togo et al. 2019)]
MLRNAGGVWSHEFYFDCMTPKPASACPCGTLAKAVDAAFGSCERLRDVMTQSALTRFGAGWAWLACDGDGRLRVLSTGNQDTPLPLGLRPVLCVDVWEHAYYLKYPNLRPIISKPGGPSTGSSPGKITRPAVEKFPSKTCFSDFAC